MFPDPMMLLRDLHPTPHMSAGVKCAFTALSGHRMALAAASAADITSLGIAGVVKSALVAITRITDTIACPGAVLGTTEACEYNFLRGTVHMCSFLLVVLLLDRCT